MKITHKRMFVMLTLYIKETCPFSQRVLQMADKLNISLDVRDILEDAEAEAELLEKGGKSQVPFLVDAEKNVSMYESNDIIEYLRSNYANTATPVSAGKPRVHISNSVCESCEG